MRVPMKSLAVVFMLMSTAQAHTEPLPSHPKIVGEIVFNERVRACWAPNNCEMLSPYRTWIVWKRNEIRKQVPLGKRDMGGKPNLTSETKSMWMGDEVCVTSALLTRDPTECAWVAPIPREVRSYIEQ